MQNNYHKREVTDEDLRTWCVRLKNCKSNGKIYEIPHIENGMILDLGGPIMRVKVAGHNILLVQVHTEKHDRKYRICRNIFWKSRVSIQRIS